MSLRAQKVVTLRESAQSVGAFVDQIILNEDVSAYRTAVVYLIISANAGTDTVQVEMRNSFDGDKWDDTPSGDFGAQSGVAVYRKEVNRFGKRLGIKVTTVIVDATATITYKIIAHLKS